MRNSSREKDMMDDEFENPLGVMSTDDRDSVGSPSTRSSQHISELAAKHQSEDTLTDEEFGKIEAVFTKMDTDDNGYVSREELAAALRDEDPTVTEEKLDRVMRILDTDGSGSISAAEFRSREEEKLRMMKTLYGDMVWTFEQGAMCRALVFYLIFTFIYFTVIFMQLKIRHSFDVEDGLKDALAGMKSQGGVTFSSVTDPAQFWEWMMTALVPSVYKAKQYNGETMNPYEKNYIASFNRVVGGMFMIQERRLRANAGNRYSKFYPVEYLDETDDKPFGPLYVECTDGQTEDCTEPTFDKNLALLENSGIEGITDICDTFENVPLREEFCDGVCLVTHDQTKSWDSSNQQCVTCRGMCISHFEEEDRPETTSGSLERICSSCIDYYEADGAHPVDGIYAPLGDLHFHTSAPQASRCANYRSRCSQLLCDICIDPGPLPLTFNAPIAFDSDSVSCFARLPICDDYLYAQRQLTCARTTLPEIGGCEPRTIGQGVCDPGCNTEACEWDRGDCCATNLEERGMASCAATWNGTAMSWAEGDSAIGDGSCHFECWNEFCLQDGGDCSFCTESCFKPAVSIIAGCNACRDDCRGTACQEVCPGHTACTGECSACEMERSCFSEEMLLGGQRPSVGVPASRMALVQSLPHCLPQNVGDGSCDFECFTDECSFDGGDCGTCSPECVLRQGDGICDAECYDGCPREIEDCPDCSDGCTPFEVGDGVCNPECYNPLCSFDSGDCYYCGAECVRKMGDGHCDPECYIGACELDGGDCNVCNAATGCLNSLVNNGVCDKQCFNFECNFDGQDCYHCDLRPECSDRFVGDGMCDYDCYHEDCAWDGGDCDTVCKTSEYGICKAYMTLDSTCQRECYYEECGWDGDMAFISDAEGWGPRTGEGPCEPECAKDCQLHQIGDRNCDRACFDEGCGYDGGDCDVCATGCPWSWVHDGQCDPECFVESCFFDSDASDVNGAVGDCRSDTSCAVGCSPFMVGNGNCDANCTSAACGFDGGDCGMFCDAAQNCPISWVNNGACDVACFEAHSCERDGRDCNFSPRCSRGCVDYVMLANARCEPACNTTECGYDYGDCGVDVPDSFIGESCFPGYVFDCSIECVRVTGIRDGICNSIEAKAANSSIIGNFNCEAFFWDFGDCEVQACTESVEPSVADCSGTCAPISAVGDGTCHDGNQTAMANFDCQNFFFDMGDCEEPQEQTVEAALELGVGLNESAALLDEASPARAAFELNFVLDLGRSLGVPTGSVRITGILAVGQTEGRRRQLQDRNDGRDGGSRGDRVTPPPPPVVVTMLVEFEISFDNPVAARQVVDEIAVQASDPTSPLRSGNTTSLVTRADTVRLDVPESWVADLNEAIVAASCDGVQLQFMLTYGNVAWSLTRFPEESPLQSGTTDLVDEVFCVPEGVYSMRVEPVSELGGACCSGDWTVKIKDTTAVLADGTDFQHRSTTVFEVGHATVVPESCEEPPCEEEPLVGPPCAEPPCSDVISMGGFTCLPLWISTAVTEDPDTGEQQSTQMLNQGCAPHPTLGATVGVGFCKVYDLHQVANSGCDDPDLGSGCGHFYWDFCEVDGGLSFLYVSATTGEPQPAFASIEAGEFRYFLFDAFAGAPYTLSTSSAGLSDSVMFLYDTDGVTEIAYNDDYDGLMSRISWVAPSAGTYIVGVRGYSPSQTGGFFLSVEVDVPENPCDPNPCMNNGVCTDITYTFVCECIGDFSGTTCNMPNLDGVDYIEATLCPSSGMPAVSEVGLLSSQSGAMYDNNADCGLHIETPPGTAIALAFTAFAMESNFDYVYVYDGDSSSATQLARYDGWDTPPTVTTLGGNHMYVRMTSDGSVSDAGFDAIWTTVDPSDLPPPPPPNPCSGGIGLTGGGAVDFTGGYNNGAWCQWTLTCAGTITLEFSSFSTEANFDFVTVNDGPDSSAPILLDTSGSYYGGPLTSSGSSLRIQFTSDGSVTGDGFAAIYTCEDPGDPCSGGMTVSPPFMVDFHGSSAAGEPCLWTLSCNDRPVNVFFYSLAATGAGDAVSLYEGGPGAGLQIGGDLSGTDVPDPVVSETSTITLQATAGAAFEAQFECGPEPNPCDTGGNGEFQVGADACDPAVTSLLCGSGAISSGAYADDATCSWRVQCDGGGPATIVFSSFAMEANFDFVYIGDHVLTGSSIPAPITIESSSAIDIQLESDASVPGQGFALVVECPGGGGGGGGVIPGIGGEDACNGGATLHGSSEIEFSLPALGAEIYTNCIWNLNCVNGPVALQFQAFAAVAGSEASVFEDDTNLQTLSGELPFGSVSSTDWSFTSSGNTLGLEFFANGETDTSFRATASCPNDVHVPPPPLPLDPCASGEYLIGGGEIDFTGSYQSGMSCTWDIFCDVSGTVATITFASFSTESGFDFVGVDHIPMTPCSTEAWDTCYSGPGPGSQPITNGNSDMQVTFQSDGSVEDEGFLATVTCEPDPANGRRRQQDQPSSEGVNGTRSRDLIAETNVDAFKYDSDKCIAANTASSVDTAACAAIMDGWDMVTDPDGLEDLCDANSACQFLGGQKAFVFLIPLDFSEQTIELNITSLVDYMWVDQKTWTVEVRFATYNGNKKLFSIVHMKMQFDLSGQTKKSLLVDSVNLELWGTWTDSVRIGLELCILLFATVNFFTEMRELRALGFSYFADAWNYVDILNVWLFAWSALTWMYLFIVATGIEIPNKFDMSRPEDKTKLLSVMDTLDESTKRFQRYIMITSVNVMVCFVRFFKFVKVQERLNIVNETLAKASVDLLHFTISFMISFLCFAVMGCVMFGFKMTEFKTVTDAFHALFNMSIGDTGLWEEMRRIHPLAGTVYQYVFFLFMGFTMINIFLAIIMDSYAEVVGEARSRGAHTILHDLNKAQAVFATSKKNPFPAYTMATGTRVNYREAAELARDPYVEDLTQKAQNGEKVEFTPEVLKRELRPELTKFLADTYSRMAEGESDPVDDLHTLVQAVHVETNQRFNDLERRLAVQAAQSEARILAALGATPAPQVDST